MHFPFIKTVPVGNIHEALAAIRVPSLLHSDLLVNTYYGEAEVGKYAIASKIYPRKLHHDREALLSDLSGWADTTLEIRLAVVPDQAHRTPSLINLHHLIRCRGRRPKRCHHGCQRFQNLDTPTLGINLPATGGPPAPPERATDVHRWLVARA